MLDTVWRVSARNFDVDSFLEKFQIPNVCSVFHTGEKGLRNRVYDKSGFTALVSEETNSFKNTEEIENFIKNNSEAITYLFNHQVEYYLDIGCTVGTTDQFTKTTKLTISLIALLHQYNVEIEFSAYPSSE